MNEQPDDSDESAPEGWWGTIRSWLLPLLLIPVVFQLSGWLRAPSLPDQAPEFNLAGLDGNEVALADFRGQTVVLNFWATWCGPCRFEIPSFSRFARNNPDIPVLGIAADGSPGQLKAAKKSMGIDYPVLIGDRATLNAYGVSVFPTTVVVGPDGEVVSAHAGLMWGPQLWWATR